MMAQNYLQIHSAEIHTLYKIILFLICRNKKILFRNLEDMTVNLF